MNALRYILAVIGAVITVIGVIQFVNADEDNALSGLLTVITGACVGVSMLISARYAKKK